jgi:hypothetical protein
MACLFSNSEYRYCVVYGEVCGSALRTQKISVRLLLVGVHEGLGIFDPKSQQFAITEVCWKEWKNHFSGIFIMY